MIVLSAQVALTSDAEPRAMVARICAAVLLAAMVAGCAERVEVRTVQYGPGRACNTLGCYVQGCGYFLASDSSWTERLFESYDYRGDYVLYRMADASQPIPRTDQFLDGDLSGQGIRTVQVEQTGQNVDIDVLAHFSSFRIALAALQERKCWKRP